MNQKIEKYSLKSKAMYGCGDMFAGGAFLLIGLLFLNYLTDVVLLSPALAGSIFLVGKIWDAISDPLMGVLSDRTKSRFGRRRIYFLIGILPIFFTFAMLWYPVMTQSQAGKFIYYMIAYILFNTVFTMVMIPYNSILPNMTTNYMERNSFTTIRLMFSAVSAILSGVLPMMIVNWLGEPKTTGYLVMGIVFGALYALPWVFVFKGTWENEYVADDTKFSIKNTYKEFGLAFRNRSFRLHMGFFVSGQTAVDILTTLFIYYLTYCLNRGHQFSLVLGVLLIVQLIAMPLHMNIAKKWGKTAPLKVGQSIWIVALLISLFLKPESPAFLIFLVAGLSGIGSAASTFVPWSILPEISDVDELITGRRREGVYSGMSTFIRKIAQATSVFLIGVALDLLGYVPDVAQSDGTILGIKLLFAIAPIVFIMLALFFSSKYKMTEKKHTILMEELGLRRQNVSHNADKKTIEICEELTGIKYEDLGK